ncbi:hypothetical protein DLM75_07625 [Leptospira stimsonii]|uniref:Uncharacterized protein n=1 Tax=Leptospira stimsonii TaxID=2202203 RepID=A0A396ZCS7_9LEPT|nr:hypothetical protein DLM75_07625 [Leptospira stimsonii]
MVTRIPIFKRETNRAEHEGTAGPLETLRTKIKAECRFFFIGRMGNYFPTLVLRILVQMKTVRVAGICFVSTIFCAEIISCVQHRYLILKR